MSTTLRILIGLLAGIALGAALRAADLALLPTLLAIADPVGGLWLDALRMSIVPLVFALVITGIASASHTASSGGLAARALLLMIMLLLASALLSALFTPLLLQLWPIAEFSATALRAVTATTTEIPATPGTAQWLRALIPENPIRAAADGAMLPLVIFAVAFGFATTAIEASARDRLTGFFQAMADALLVIVHWVLWAAPVGVFALAFLLGARSGLDAAGALVHYVLVLIALMLVMGSLVYLFARVAARVPLARFARAAAPAQAVAASTQSSLASLPAMVEGCATHLGLSRGSIALVLPLAVSVFRVTSPGVNLAIAIYAMHLYGIDIHPLPLATAVAVAIITSMASVSLPGQLTFYTTSTPICLVLGVPLDLLPLLLAVETIPDIFRTIVNVTADIAVTAVIDRA